MEHVLCSHIRFRACHITETQLLFLTYDLLYQSDQGHSVDIAILDFSKAFDTVPHCRLLGKLEYYGITGDQLRWIEGFLLGRKQVVLVDGVQSAEEYLISGVPEGTILGALLFLLNVNDMPLVLDTSTSADYSRMTL